MKQIKLIILKLIFFLIFFNQSSFSKGLPPGTGVGDLPVNILILLDTSQSMEHKPLKGEGIDPPNSLAIIDSAVLVGESPGVEKYIVDTKGEFVNYFYSTTKPMSTKITSILQQ